MKKACEMTGLGFLGLFAETAPHVRIPLSGGECQIRNVPRAKDGVMRNGSERRHA